MADSDIKVVFATPCMGGVVGLNFHRATRRMDRVLTAAGIQCGYTDRDNDPYLARVRNKLLTHFLDRFEGATDLFWIDSDVGDFPPEKVIEFLRAPEPVLAGIYPKKMMPLDFPWEPVIDAETCEIVSNERGMLLTRVVPTGFLRMKRAAVEQLAAASGKFWAQDSTEKEIELYNVFETGIGQNQRFWGEDCAMSEKWLRLGGELWVDPDVQFTHHGQAMWAAKLSDSLHLYRERALAMKTLSGKAA
jgi:hypothetical protein